MTVTAKRALVLAFASLIVASACTGCDLTGENKSAPEQVESSVPSVSEPAAIDSSYSGEATAIVGDDGKIFAVADNGFIISNVTMEDDMYSEIRTGSTFYNVKVTVAEDGRVSAHMAPPYSETSESVSFDSTDSLLEKSAADALLGRLLNSGRTNSISGYTVKGTKTELIGGHASVTLEYDFQPTSWATAYEAYNPFDGQMAQSDPAKLSAKVTIKLAGCENRWVVTDDGGLMFAEPVHKPEPKSFVPGQNQYFLYENSLVALYYERSYIGEETADSPQEYDTVLYARTPSGAVTELSEKMRNCDFGFVADVSGNILLETDCWAPYSESYPGNMYCLMTETMTLTELPVVGYAETALREAEAIPVAKSVSEEQGYYDILWLDMQSVRLFTRDAAGNPQYVAD